MYPLLKSAIACILFQVIWMPSNQAQVTLPGMISASLNNTSLKNLPAYARDHNTYLQKNVQSRTLPQIVFSGQATYQSDVTQIGTDVPVLGIEPLALDQYQIRGEINQLLFDGGAIKSLGSIESARLQQENAETQIQLDEISKQVIEIYFRILQLQEGRKIFELKEQVLEQNLYVLQEAVNLGSVLENEAQSLRVAQIQLEQQKNELSHQLQTQKSLLSLLSGRTLDATTEFIIPEDIPPAGSVIYDPQVELFQAHKEVLEHTLNNKNSTTMPRFDLFLQGGYGRPGLNFLKNEFKFYYIAGIRARWDISAFYRKQANTEITELQKLKIDARENHYNLQVESSLIKYHSKIKNMMETLEKDEEIIAMYESIRQTAEVQLENGVIRSHDLIEKINAENEARINRVIHDLSRKKSLYLLQHLSGAYIENKM